MKNENSLQVGKKTLSYLAIILIKHNFTIVIDCEIYRRPDLFVNLVGNYPPVGIKLRERPYNMMELPVWCTQKENECGGSYKILNVFVNHFLGIFTNGKKK